MAQRDHAIGIRLLQALQLAALLPLGCGGSGETPTTPARSVTLALRIETSHFRLYADAVPEGVLQDLALALERELPRLQSDLQVTSTRPFGVRVFQDESAWFAEVQSYFGRRIDTSGYVTEPEEGIRGRVVRLRPTALSSVAARSVRAIASLGEE